MFLQKSLPGTMTSLAISGLQDAFFMSCCAVTLRSKVMITRRSLRVLKGKVEFDGDAWDHISKDAKSLIKKMIAKPEKRLTAQECLEHKWFFKTSKDTHVDPKTVVKDEKIKSFKSYVKTQKLQ